MASKKPAKKTSKKPAKKSSKPSGGKKKQGIAAAPQPSELPTSADLAYLDSLPDAAASDRSPPADLGYLFTPAMVKAMQQPGVVAFFGEALAIGSLESDAIGASNAAATRDRMSNGQEKARAAYAAKGQPLADRLAEMNKRWDGFAAAHAAEAQQLQALRTWWEQHHKGGKAPKKADEPAK